MPHTPQRTGTPAAKYSVYRPMDAGKIPALGMDADVWRRHASGWSVWTRFATLPLLHLAVWSHAWYGWPTALAAIALVCIWLWLNPRLFPPPKRFDSWHVRATFGERVWLNRLMVPIPDTINRRAMALSLVTGIGFVIGLWGAVTTSLAPLVIGLVLTYAGKMTFLQTMVRLYDEMRDAHPVYRSWSITPDNDNAASHQTGKRTRRQTGG
ncbi:hypothetical protein GCM10007285_02340 [Stappia taiwanensis]|nr:DUF6653 family protein [Stappia taiwanensis]GGE78023.1 hypothetical protein GCM10007285_02340 [Stappia taiwanensis]